MYRSRFLEDEVHISSFSLVMAIIVTVTVIIVSLTISYSQHLSGGEKTPYTEEKLTKSVES